MDIKTISANLNVFCVRVAAEASVVFLRYRASRDKQRDRLLDDNIGFNISAIGTFLYVPQLSRQKLRIEKKFNVKKI